LFKTKTPKKLYLQVKASLINDDKDTIVFMNDFTKIKELESTSNKMRSMFFSSVAHELRTPLNSIIPITAILLAIIKDPGAIKFLKII
jgi:two-component system, sensor histidine kinase and response regulator